MKWEKLNSPLLISADANTSNINQSDKSAKPNEIALKCISCSSETDRNCTSNVQKGMTIFCPLIETDIGCYHKINGEFHSFNVLYHITFV